MTEFLSHMARFGEALPAWFLAMSAWTGALLLFALAVDWLTRRHVSPAWRVALYAAVFGRLFLPAQWNSPWGLWSFSSEGAATASASALVGPEAPILMGLRDASGSALETSVANSAPVLGLGHALALVYVVVAMALGLRAWRSLARLRRELASATPVSPAIGAMAPEHQMLEHPRLGPLALGLANPVIVLPRDVIEGLRREELAGVVAHEQAHLQRRDPVVALALTSVCCAFWPLLPIWFASARVRQLVELAADERALRTTDPKTYGKTLLKLADRPAPRLAAGLHLGAFRRLRGRILGLRRRPSLPLPVQVGLALGVPAFALSCAGAAGPEGEDPDALARACEELKQRATVAHDEREKTRDAATSAEASDAYDAYAERCDHDPDYADLLYYRAELEWARAADAHAAGRADEAKTRFRAAREAFQLALEHEPERFSTDAAYGQLMAKWNELETDVEPPENVARGRGGGNEFPMSDYTDTENQLLRAYDTFQSHVDDPDSRELQRVLYLRARLAAEHNRFDEAEAAARELLDHSDATPVHVWTAEILTDVLTIRWVDPEATPESRSAAGARLADWLRRVQGMELWELDEAVRLREAVSTLDAGIAWKRGMRERERGEFGACAATFENLANAHPDHERLDALLFNAASCHAEDGSERDLRRVVDRMRRDVPESPRLSEALALVNHTP